MHRLLRPNLSKNGLLFLALAGWLLASQDSGAQGQTPPANAAAQAGSAVNGQKLFNSIGCWQCHGYSAQGIRPGQVLDRTRIARTPLPFARFTAYIRMPTEDMPPYTAKVMSDAQLADIYAFLKAIPPPRDSKEIPLLNQKED